MPPLRGFFVVEIIFYIDGVPTGLKRVRVRFLMKFDTQKDNVVMGMLVRV